MSKKIRSVIQFYVFFCLLWLLQNGALSQENISRSESITLNHKCGFPVVLQSEASRDFSRYQLFYESGSRESALDSIYYTPSGRFKIFYSTTGPDSIRPADRNGNGTADYLEFVANSFDRAWQVEIDSLGFLPPPDSTGNVRTVYPVYCRRLSIYGVTYLDYEIPQLPFQNYVTSIEINTRFNFVTYPGVTDPIVRDSMAIAVTAAHEFNHALQSGYRLWPDGSGFFHDIWFIESSATCMEEVVAPEVNDYLNYLDDYFRRTFRPFDESTGFLSDYGKVVLEIMLGVKYDYFLVRQVWEGILERRALPAMERVLLNYQTDFANELQDLVVWLYYIRERNQPGRYFPDAALFPELTFIPGEEFGESRSELVADSLPRLSFQWYLSPVTTSQNFQVKLDVNSQGIVSSLRSNVVNPATWENYWIPANTVVDLPYSISSFEFPFTVISTDTSGIAYLPYRFIVNVKGAPLIANTVVYPQPFRMSEQQPFLTFGNLKAGSTLTIFNSNGLFVRQFPATNDNTPVLWDLKDKNGNMVGSGVYIFQVEVSGETKRGKLVIVR